MRRFAVLTGVLLGFMATAGDAHAAPIGTNACALGATGFECDIFVDDVTGESTLDASALAPNWLVGYTFLLSLAADLSDGIQATDVAHALVFHANSISLFTPLVGSPVFAQVIANALALAPIDGTPLSEGQIVGFPIAGGVTQLNGVGLFNTADTVAMLSQIAWGLAPGAIGGYDSLTVHTGLADVQPPTTPVPEPGTLSLLALGSGIVAAARRRAKNSGKN